jgi:imidazole glycerol-phosphate synthase subunit HisF
MLLNRIIPCLDVRDGRVVKGVRFEGLRDVGDPATLAAGYAADGADEIVMLDVSATIESRSTMLDTVAAVRAVIDVPLTVGGGIRDVSDAAAALQAGADRVSINSAAVQRPSLVDELADRFGSQCVVVAIDARRRETGGWETLIAAGRTTTGIDAVAWAIDATARGAGEVLLTSHDRDGTGEGYDLDLVRAVAGSVRTPVIASGGARVAADLESAFQSGASAALLAGVLHDQITTIRDLRRALMSLGRELRPC